MTVFGNARRLAAWAGVCPGNHESAGRSRKTSTRKGKAESSSITNTLRIWCRDGVGGLVHQPGEHLVGGREAERLARPAVEPGRDRVEFGLREHRQVSAFG